MTNLERTQLPGTRAPESPATGLSGPLPPRPARRRDRNWSLLAGGILAALIAFATIFHSLLEPYPPGSPSLSSILKGPSSAHLLGTDSLGRDELSRVLAGLPWSIGITVVAVAIATTLGTLLGLAGVVYAGWPRFVVRRVTDFGIAFPLLVIAVVAIVVVGHGFIALAGTLGVVAWPIFARVTLAQGLSAATEDYVLAAQLMGVGPFRRALRHILPAIRHTLIAMVAFLFADLLLLEAALSYLGLGAPVGTPTWGNLLADSTQYLVNAPWLLAAPAGALVLVVVSANLLGDGLAKLADVPATSAARPWLFRWSRGGTGRVG
jgi:peptide/nickel transport system permease protein